MFAGYTGAHECRRANRGGGVMVLWIYRARMGSGQRSRRRCSTWARTGAHLHEERSTVVAVTAHNDARGRGRPRVDTGSRPAPDIRSPCPVSKSVPVFSLSLSLFVTLFVSRSYPTDLSFWPLFSLSLSPSFSLSLSFLVARTFTRSLARARETRR